MIKAGRCLEYSPETKRIWAESGSYVLLTHSLLISRPGGERNSACHIDVAKPEGGIGEEIVKRELRGPTTFNAVVRGAGRFERSARRDVMGPWPEERTTG